MKVFHGGYNKIKSPEIIEEKYAKDFGIGFYCTELKEQSIRWAKRYETPTVNVYEYTEDVSLRIIDFKEMSEEWLDFVVICFCSEKALSCLSFIKSENV
jgi:hypothetical protein